jgi:outer membrane beta-barrel protein
MKTLAAIGPLLAAAALGALAPAAFAQESKPANEQVIVPEVDRRDVKLPRIAAKDIEVGVFAGTYATQNFGAAPVAGVRLGYHITEDVFVVGAYGASKADDEAFRRILPGGVIAEGADKLTYINLSAGYNLLPGEVFLGRSRAKASALYLIGGVGTTKFNEQSRQTLNFGLGLRVYLGERSALQVDMRDHLFSLDLLGKRQNTHNLELTAGFAYYF